MFGCQERGWARTRRLRRLARVATAATAPSRPLLHQANERSRSSDAVNAMVPPTRPEHWCTATRPSVPCPWGSRGPKHGPGRLEVVSPACDSPPASGAERGSLPYRTRCKAVKHVRVIRQNQRGLATPPRDLTQLGVEAGFDSVQQPCQPCGVRTGCVHPRCLPVPWHGPNGLARCDVPRRGAE